MGNVWSGNTKSWSHVRTYDDVSVGDELCYYHFPRYRWGIVTQKDPCGEFSLVGFHLKVIDGMVRKEKYNFHLDGFSYHKASYQRQLSNQEAMQNALSRLGENEYSRLTNFARAFTRWCKTGSRDILSQHHDIRAKEEVTLQQLSMYDHVVIFIQKHYHHGLVLSSDVSAGTITMVHYSDVTSGAHGTCRPYKSTLRYRTGHLMRIKYSKADKPETILKRVDMILNEQAWVERRGGSPVSGTCEQFVTWLITGKITRTQVTLSEAIAELEEKEKEEGAAPRAVLRSQRSMPDHTERLPIHQVQQFLDDRLAPITGMEAAKQQVRDYVSSLLAGALRAKEGLPGSHRRPVLCLLGNPGTGKTFIAQQLTEVMFHLGLITTPSFLEVSKEDLMAGTTAQTLAKTNEAIYNAREGALMVDDLPSFETVSSGHDVIQAFIGSIEGEGQNIDDRPAYIFAGNKLAMESCLKTNRELNSKKQCSIEFSDYTADELAGILEEKLTASGLVFQGQRAWLRDQMQHYFSVEQRARHNVRLCELLVERTRLHLDRRVAHLFSGSSDIDTELLLLLNKGDIESALEQLAAAM